MSQEFEEQIPAKWKPDYRSGRMSGVLTFLQHLGVQKHDFIKSGSTCVVWKFPIGHNLKSRGSITDSQYVIKLCTKRIEYFKSFRKASVNDFQECINQQFRYKFLPIHDILYEDSMYFVYSQECVKILDFSEIDQSVIIQILEIIKTMFTNQLLTCDLITSNFGWTSSGRTDAHGSGSRQLYLLDYHDMKPTSDFFQQAKWSKMVRCLVEYFSRWLFHRGFEDYTKESMMEWKSELTIAKKKFGAQYFPEHLVALLQSFSSCDPDPIIKHLTRCLTILRNGPDQSVGKQKHTPVVLPRASKHLHRKNNQPHSLLELTSLTKSVSHHPPRSKKLPDTNDPSTHQHRKDPVHRHTKGKGTPSTEIGNMIDVERKEKTPSPSVVSPQRQRTHRSKNQVEHERVHHHHHHHHHS